MKVLVTGAAGFIGFHLSKRLVEAGFEVVGFDNINNYYSRDLKYDRLQELGISRNQILEDSIIESMEYENLQFIKADLENKSVLKCLFAEQKFDVVINLAARPGCATA
jgi:UDP-glucuronate 4-epimerase